MIDGLSLANLHVTLSVPLGFRSGREKRRLGKSVENISSEHLFMSQHSSAHPEVTSTLLEVETAISRPPGLPCFATPLHGAVRGARASLRAQSSSKPPPRRLSSPPAAFGAPAAASRSP